MCWVFIIVFLTSYFMLHTVPHYTETTPDNSWLCCIIILALSWSSLALFDGLLHWCQRLAFYSAPSARVWISQPGSYSKAQMTAILTRNDAFVPDCGLELVSKPHILPLFSHQRHFYQAGIKQKTSCSPTGFCRVVHRDRTAKNNHCFKESALLTPSHSPWCQNDMLLASW